MYRKSKAVTLNDDSNDQIKDQTSQSSAVTSQLINNFRKASSQPVPSTSDSINEQGQSLALLPPLSEKYKGKKTLVLDLDETLIHSSPQKIPNADLIVPVSF
jgi:RNA polymerase II subunit A small phosphatase-like protein